MAVFEYIATHPDQLMKWVIDHLMISFIAIGIATVIGVSLGVVIAGENRKSLAEIVLYLAEIMMTVPSMALFGLFMLFLGFVGLPAIGLLPAIVTLVIYGQLPILRNTYTALQEVDRGMVEAGKAMGMNDWQLLFRIKLPLAVPVIMAGLRNAMILIIGIAAIAALIGSGGLGVPIFRGLRNARMDLIIIGGVGVSIVALIVDGCMALVQKKLIPKELKENDQ